MTFQKPARTLESISDAELECCVDGSTNLDMLRDLLLNNVDFVGWVDTEDFASAFACAIEGFIDADENTAEWREAWDNNLIWAKSIGDNINELLAVKVKLKDL